MAGLQIQNMRTVVCVSLEFLLEIAAGLPKKLHFILKNTLQKMEQTEKKQEAVSGTCQMTFAVGSRSRA